MRENPTSFAPTTPWMAAVVGVSVVLSLYTARKAGICVDDAFITATYARNLATGHGMVFNTGEYILGVTTPLWCLLQAAVMLVAPFAREGVGGMMALAFGAHVWAGVALALLAARVGAGWWGWLAPVGWIFMPHHVSLFGMEYGLATALTATALLLFFAGRGLLCGIFCSLLALTRPEAALLPLMLFGVLLGRRQWHQAIRFAIPVAVVGITTLTLFQLYYGSPVPNTFGAKRMQLANREEFVWLQSVGRGAWQYLLVEILRGALAQALLVIFGLLGIIATFWRMRGRPRLLATHLPMLFLAWVVIHILALTVLGVAFYTWYLWPLWMVVPLAVAVGLGQLAGMIPHGPHRWAALITVVVILVVGWQAHWTGDPAGSQRDRREGYFQIAREINLRAGGQQVSVLATEIGALGFALDSNVRVLDQVLLVSENPTPGRFPSDRDFVDIHHPEFIAETHPFSADHTREQLAHQDLRRDPNFELVFEYEGGRTVRYHVANRIESRFGLQVLLQRVD